jgi:hypothetical protein
MKILVKFPTRGRKNKFFNTLMKYYSLSENKNLINYLVTLDNDDTIMNDSDVREILDSYNNLNYMYGDSKSKVDAVNRDLENFTEWDILILASDDMIPQVKNYDSIIINDMKTNFPDTDGVLWYNDGNQKNNLNTLCIIGKKYFERFNYVYHPEYKSTWCDNEFTEVSKILNKQKYFENIIIKHEHPDWGYGNHDLIHSLNVINEDFDRSLYLKRKMNNFGL